MSKSSERNADKQQAEAGSTAAAQQPSSSEEARVWKVLEQARQNVKQAAKRELEGEIISSDVLNLRLRALE